MRILFFINTLGGGGAERVVSTLSHYLTHEKNHQITIVTLQKPECLYELPPSVSILSLKSGVLNVGFGKILFLPIFALEFSLILKKIKPDAVISFLVRSNLVHTMTKWFGNKSQIVLSERGPTQAFYSANSFRDRMMRALIRLLYPRADSIIAISKGIKDGLRNFGVLAERVTVIYNPQDIGDMKVKSQENGDIQIPANIPTFIAVGRLDYEKDHKTLLDALKKIKETLNCHLIIMGEGPLEGKLKEYSKTLRVSDSVSWLGWQSNPFATMAKADLFILTSKYEGFGNVLIEAMVCGLPIISTDCPSGPREILKNGSYGILVPVGDSEAIAQAVISILQNKGLYEKMKNSGYERAAQFDVHFIVPQYLDVLGLN